MRTIVCLVVSAMVFAACVDSSTPSARQGPDKAPPAIEPTYALGLSTRQFDVHSASLGQERQVQVLLPPGYGDEPLRVVVSGTLQDPQSGVSSVDIQCTRGDGDPKHRTGERRTFPSGTASGRYSVEVPVTEGRWTVVVTAADHAGNRSTTQATFTVTVPRPEAYATLYVNDGQDIGGLRLEETLGRMYLAGELRPLVVVAIPSMNRRREYGTNDGRASIPCDFGDGHPGRGDQALEYERFLTEELVPHIRANFRVSPEPRETGVLGESLGGLSAFNTTWNRSDVFGIAGALSGSFWWREKAGSLENRLASRIMHRLVREGAHRPLRAWFQAGTQDERSDRNDNGVIDAIEDTLDLMAELEKKGYSRERELAYVEVKDGKHDLATWATALPLFLRWAYP
jgi:enterochelin esterase-like enzyme